MEIIVDNIVVGNIPKKIEDFSIRDLKVILSFCDKFKYNESEYLRKVLHQISKYYNECSTWRLKIRKQLYSSIVFLISFPAITAGVLMSG